VADEPFEPLLPTGAGPVPMRCEQSSWVMTWPVWNETPDGYRVES